MKYIQFGYKSLNFLIYVFPLKLYEIDTTWIQKFENFKLFAFLCN